MSEIIPAILTNDISDFRKKYAELFALGHYFKKLHIDFVDGEYLPHKTVMPKDLPDMNHSPFELMAHFMAYDPNQYFLVCKDLGFKWVIIHYEAFHLKTEIDDAIDAARKLGLKVGLAINPETKPYKIALFIKRVDMIQLMGVHPGAQGRPFEYETLEKVRELKKLTKNVIICVDGGAKIGIAKQIAEAGADWIIAGSAIAKSEHPKQSIEELLAEIKIQ
jgi:ribulose-phosphate 3-epimerase